MIFLIIKIAILVFVLFIMFVLLRQILFFGFDPFLSTRPKELEKIFEKVDVNERKKIDIYALGFGRSGFLKVAEKIFPEANLVGAEDSYFYYLLAKVQVFLRRSKIKVVYSDFYRFNVRKADILYCYLNPEDLREIYKKLIVDTKNNAQIVSMGFAMPYLEPIDSLMLEPGKRWFHYFSKRNKEFFTPKERKEKRDDKVYFYEL